MRLTLFPLLFLGLASALCAQDKSTAPNIVLIYLDDLGYGDVGAYGSKSIPTPNMDRLAREGIRFTSGYATSSTCTPSRFALLTGQYPWRKKGTGILPGDAALIIPTDKPTLPSMLQKAGYRTGVVGKWHLGLGTDTIDWNGEIKPSPVEVGFTESFIMAATADRVPCVYVRNHRVVGLDPADPITVSYGKPIPGEPTGKSNPELLRVKPSHGHDQAIVNGISRIGHMKGGKAALWKDEDMADTFTAEAVRFIEASKDKPFFLFFALHDPHVPRVPHPRFVGKTQLGPRGDSIVQADWCAGEILQTLDRLKLAENTVVILSSDNGPVLDDGYQDQAVAKNGDHKPWGPWRGGKYSKFEAGTRVPFVLRWPARVKPAVSDAIVSQIDLAASFAALTGQTLGPDDFPDSLNLLPALTGTDPVGRADFVQQGIGGLALRSGNWKLIETAKGPKNSWNTGIETGNDPQAQLYDLAADPGERNNIADKHPEKVKELQARLNALREAGRSRAK